MNYAHRRQKIAALLAKTEVDALLFCLPENLRYLCGFTGTEGALVITTDSVDFLTDSRYTAQAEDEVSADKITEYKNKLESVVDHLKARQVTKVGFEAGLSYGQVMAWQKKGEASWQWRALADELHALRLHKTDEEIAAISEVAGLNARAFHQIQNMIRPGVTEAEISLELEFAMRRLGAEDKAFDYIVASGPRGAMPHGVASDKVLAEGELVTIDFGGRLRGYHSDETITLALGEVTGELRTIFDVVLEAHDRAIDAVQPGLALIDIDNVARDYIKDCGYGEFFGHGLGHGVGLEIHEAPTVSPRSKLVAEEGMVITIEPGIYLPGVGGVRIEDMVLVDRDGCKVLTKIPKTFRNILLN